MLETLIVNQSEVPRLLPMKECIDVMARAFAALARGEARMPQRQIVWLDDKSGALGLMPAHLPSQGALGLKVVTVFPGNDGTELDSHQGAVLLFEAERGRLLAIIDATSVTAVRTAAVSGLATRLLAREDAGDLALLGSGVQARTHLEAMLARAQDPARARRERASSPRGSFAERESRRHGITVDAVRLGAGGRRGRRPRLHDDLVARARRSRGTGCAPARTSTPSARASPRPASSTRRGRCARASSWTARSRAQRGGRLPDPEDGGRHRRRAHRRRARRAGRRRRRGAPSTRPRSPSSSRSGSRSRTSRRRSTSTAKARAARGSESSSNSAGAATTPIEPIAARGDPRGARAHRRLAPSARRSCA